ncbi:hypothetical protein QOZ80_7AG0572030 [Eleusine coracana subsp. coracana]|nr:hypothetical protein QOZ80_7AG0572030 [Eleusine coracana subsp. coracana]
MAEREKEASSAAAAGRPEEEPRRGDSDSEGEEGVAAMLDFDMLCASVALAAERRKGAAAAEADGDGGGGGGGVQRMWEGDVVLDCVEDRWVALEAAWVLRAVWMIVFSISFVLAEARTLEMNNVQCGVWHGRGDTICLGSNGEGNKAFTTLNKPSFVPTKSPGLCGMDRTSNGADELEPLVPSTQPLPLPPNLGE